MSPVRLAQPKDIDNIVNLLDHLHDENAMAKLNRNKVRNKVKELILGKPYTSDDGMVAIIPTGAIGVIEEDGKIVAAIGMTLGQWWYSDDWVLEELWNFVHPDHRRTTYAKDLINFFKQFSSDSHIPALIGIISHKRMEAKIRLYQRQLHQVGALFLHGHHIG